MPNKSCKKCAWWEPPKDEWDCAGFCHHGSINRTKELDETCSNWASGPKKRWKSEHMHKSYNRRVHDEIARLRAANAILVEALKEYTCKSWPWDTRDNQPFEECYAPWEPAEDALKKTGHWE